MRLVTLPLRKNVVPGGGAGAGRPGSPEHGGHPGPRGRGAAGRQPGGAEPPLPALPRLPGRGGGHHCPGPLRTQAARHTCPLLIRRQQFQDTALGLLLSKSISREQRNVPYCTQCCGSGSGSVGSICFWASWIRILLSSSKNSKKNIDSFCSATSLRLFIFDK